MAKETRVVTTCDMCGNDMDGSDSYDRGMEATYIAGASGVLYLTTEVTLKQTNAVGGPETGTADLCKKCYGDLLRLALDEL